MAKPSEILKQELDVINNRTYTTAPPVSQYSMFGLSLPEKTAPIKDPGKPYVHNVFRTRPYRHEGSATYKLIRFLEHSLKNASKIHWRAKPEVVTIEGFGSQYKMFVGRVRFSSF